MLKFSYFSSWVCSFMQNGSTSFSFSFQTKVLYLDIYGHHAWYVTSRELIWPIRNEREKGGDSNQHPYFRARKSFLGMGPYHIAREGKEEKNVYLNKRPHPSREKEIWVNLDCISKKGSLPIQGLLLRFIMHTGCTNKLRNINRCKILLLK